MFVYTVTAEIATPALAKEWLAWMRVHIDEVCASGALEATVVRWEGGPPVRCEARYLFASRAAFSAYEKDHAPRLRAEGLARFPPERGVHLSRALGELILTVP